MTFQPTPFLVATFVWALLAVPVLAAGLKGIDFAGRLGGSARGPHVDARLGWLVMELPPILVLPFFYFLGDNRQIAGDILVGAWLLHYVHRGLVWPWIVQRGSRPVPISLCAAAFSFNVVNATLIGWRLGRPADYAPDWLADPRFVAGAVLMVAGAVLNVWSDYRLARLRRRNPGGRVLPRGGAFRFVSCPNLAGEMIEWTGFALMTWSLPGLAFAMWTAANLLPRAMWRHRWYQEVFDDYPRRRRAVIPGLL